MRQVRRWVDEEGLRNSEYKAGQKRERGVSEAGQVSHYIGKE